MFERTICSSSLNTANICAPDESSNENVVETRRKNVRADSKTPPGDCETDSDTLAINHNVAAQSHRHQDCPFLHAATPCTYNGPYPHSCPPPSPFSLSTLPVTTYPASAAFLQFSQLVNFMRLSKLSYLSNIPAVLSQYESFPNSPEARAKHRSVLSKYPPKSCSAGNSSSFYGSSLSASCKPEAGTSYSSQHNVISTTNAFCSALSGNKNSSTYGGNQNRARSDSHARLFDVNCFFDLAGYGIPAATVHTHEPFSNSNRNKHSTRNSIAPAASLSYSFHSYANDASVEASSSNASTSSIASPLLLIYMFYSRLYSKVAYADTTLTATNAGGTSTFFAPISLKQPLLSWTSLVDFALDFKITPTFVGTPQTATRRYSYVPDLSSTVGRSKIEVAEQSLRIRASKTLLERLWCTLHLKRTLGRGCGNCVAEKGARRRDSTSVCGYKESIMKKVSSSSINDSSSMSTCDECFSRCINFEEFIFFIILLCDITVCNNKMPIPAHFLKASSSNSSVYTESKYDVNTSTGSSNTHRISLKTKLNIFMKILDITHHFRTRSTLINFYRDNHLPKLLSNSANTLESLYKLKRQIYTPRKKVLPMLYLLDSKKSRRGWRKPSNFEDPGGQGDEQPVTEMYENMGLWMLNDLMANRTNRVWEKYEKAWIDMGVQPSRLVSTGSKGDSQGTKGMGSSAVGSCGEHDNIDAISSRDSRTITGRYRIDVRNVSDKRVDVYVDSHQLPSYIRIVYKNSLGVAGGRKTSIYVYCTVPSISESIADKEIKHQGFLNPNENTEIDARRSYDDCNVGNMSIHHGDDAQREWFGYISLVVCPHKITNAQRVQTGDFSNNGDWKRNSCDTDYKSRERINNKVNAGTYKDTYKDITICDNGEVRRDNYGSYEFYDGNHNKHAQSTPSLASLYSFPSSSDPAFPFIPRRQHCHETNDEIQTVHVPVYVKLSDDDGNENSAMSADSGKEKSNTSNETYKDIYWWSSPSLPSQYSPPLPLPFRWCTALPVYGPNPFIGKRHTSVSPTCNYVLDRIDPRRTDNLAPRIPGYRNGGNMGIGQG